MASLHTQQRAGWQAIIAHPLFSTLVPLWFGVTFALSILAVRGAVIERLVLASHLDLILPMATPPLGTTARLLLAAAFGGLGAAIGWGALRLMLPETAPAATMKPKAPEAPYRPRGGDAHPDAPARRPISAHAELGPQGFDLHEELPQHTPMAAPVPAREPAPEPTPMSAVAPLAPPPAAIEPQVFSAPQTFVAPFAEPVAPADPLAPLDLGEAETLPPRTVWTYAPPIPLPEKEAPAAIADPAPEPEPMVAPAMAAPVPETPPTPRVGFPEPPAEGPSAAQQIAHASLDSLSHIELIERLAIAMQRREAAPAAPQAPASPQNTAPDGTAQALRSALNALREVK